MSAAIGLREPPWQRTLDMVALVAVLLILWQIVFEIVGSSGMAPPVPTFIGAWGLLSSADFWPNVFSTLRALMLALAIEISGGLLIGLALGCSPLAAEVIEPILVSIYSIPKIMFYPVILMFFGLGLAAEVAFGVLHGIVPIILFTLSAVRDIRPVLFKTAQVMSLSSWQTMTYVAMPAALPEIFTGLRIGFAGAIIGVLLSEMFGSRLGVGFMLMNAIALSKAGTTMSLILLLVLFAGVINGILLAIDERLHRRV